MNGENVFRLLRKMQEDKQVKTTGKLKAKTTNRNQKMKKELSKGDIFRKREEGFGYGTRLGETNTAPNYGRLQTGHKLATWKMKEFDEQKKQERNEQSSNLVDKSDIRPMGGRLDMFQHIYREWNEEEHIKQGKKDQVGTIIEEYET